MDTDWVQRILTLFADDVWTTVWSNRLTCQEDNFERAKLYIGDMGLFSLCAGSHATADQLSQNSDPHSTCAGKDAAKFKVLRRHTSRQARQTHMHLVVG